MFKGKGFHQGPGKHVSQGLESKLKGPLLASCQRAEGLLALPLQGDHRVLHDFIQLRRKQNRLDDHPKEVRGRAGVPLTSQSRLTNSRFK